MDFSTPAFPVHPQLPDGHVHWAGDAIQPSHPLSSPSPAFNLSQHQALLKMSQFFSSAGQSIRVSASAISPSNEYSGLISFKMDGLDVLAVQGIPKSLFQHRSSKHQFFRAQLSL